MRVLEHTLGAKLVCVKVGNIFKELFVNNNALIPEDYRNALKKEKVVKTFFLKLNFHWFQKFKHISNIWALC